MKKIIVVSDSHGNVADLQYLLNEEYDYFFFLGDGLSDLGTSIYDDRVKAVKGNWDFGSDVCENLVVGVEDVVFFLTHGHKYGVKESFFRLMYQVSELQPNLTLFGHTHRMEDFVVNGLHFANPGSINKLRGAGTYFKIIVDGKKYSIEKCCF